MTNYIYGLHAVKNLIERHPERIVRLCILKDRDDKKISAILHQAQHIPVESLSRKDMDNLSHNANHQGIIAFTQHAKTYSEKDIPHLIENLNEPAFILVLDSVQDPHNLGACFRSAEAAGVHMLIAPKDKSASITPIVSKVASGAAEIIPFVQATNLARALEMLKQAGIWIYGAAGDADNILFQTPLLGPIAIVLGAEGTGLRRLTREHCDLLLKIPMQGSVASLNVSVATGIFLFEAVRQRLS